MESLKVVLGDVAEVTLLGPAKGNACGPAFWKEAPEVARMLDADPQVRAIVLRGSGENFTYGLSLMEMAGELGPLLMEPDVRHRRTLMEKALEMQEACEGWARCRKPVVAAVHGWCIGAGMNLLSACDIRLCSQEARFSVREVKLALAPDLGALQRLPRIVGEGHARRMALTGEDVDAAQALRMGLVSEVLPTPEALFAEAHRLARTLAELPPLAVQGVKQVMNFSADVSVAEGLRFSALWSGAFLQSLDFQEALAAFAERRTPRFQGK